MQLFTFKDFITYNSPCFSCGGQPTITLDVEPVDTQRDCSYLKITCTQNLTKATIKQTYMGYNLELEINHITNQFYSNDIPQFMSFIKGHLISINNHCSKCDTIFTSDYLQFDFFNGIIKPTTINWEVIVIDNPLPAEYRVKTDNNQTNITISNIKEGVYYHKYIENLPPLPRSKFNNKEELIEKIKKYLLFS